MNCEFFRMTNLARALSWLLHPLVLPVYLVVFLLTATPFAFCSGSVRFYFAWVILLCGVVIPVLSVGVLRSLGRISDWRIDSRRERRWPLMIGALCYLLCAVALARVPSLVFLRKFMLAAACCEIMCLVVSQPHRYGRCRGSVGHHEFRRSRTLARAAGGRDLRCRGPRFCASLARMP